MTNCFNIRKIVFTSIFFIGLVFTLNAKTMPDNMIVSDDGKMLITAAKQTSGLYNIESVKTIYLEFSQSDWWTQLTNNYGKDIDIPATLIYEGTSYPNVGIRFRGFTSYQNTKNSPKKSFNISLDFLDEKQKLEGYKTLNLNNCFEDPSFLREALYKRFISDYIPATKVNFVKLVINGEDWGVYANVQQLNKDFYKEWFLSDDGSNWRAYYPDTATVIHQGGMGWGMGFGAGYCSLNYLGDDYLTYTKYYTLKSSNRENPFEDLAVACDKLNNLPTELLYDSLKYYIDIDRSLWHIACENLFTDDDGYVNKGGMDYYVYYDSDTKRIQPIEFDGNSSFLTKDVSWSPFLKQKDNNYPLISKLFANNSLLQRYAAHIRTILNNTFNESYANSLVDKYKNLIDAEVKNDSKKMYTYNQFTNSVTEIKNFIKNRKTSILKNNIIKATAPVISNVEYISNNGSQQPPISGEKVNVRAWVTCADGINKVLLYYGTGLMGVFDYTEMYDDGNHNDIIAGDGIFGAEIPAFPAGTYVRYYIESRSANSNNSSSFNPEGAEHDVYYYQVQAQIASSSQVVINELMASNSKTIADPQGEYDDWVELHNTSKSNIDISGKYLTDKTDNLVKWQFPASTVIGAGGYLVIWCDENSKDTPGIHTNFKLSASGELVIFVDSDGTTILDSVNFGTQTDDISYGRYPNGTGSFSLMNPTPWQFNDNTLSVVVESSELSNFNINSLSPNPFNGNLKIDFSVDIPGNYTISVYDNLGLKLANIFDEYLNSGEYSINWNSANLSSGVYHIIISDGINNNTKQILYLE